MNIGVIIHLKIENSCVHIHIAKLQSKSDSQVQLNLSTLPRMVSHYPQVGHLLSRGLSFTILESSATLPMMITQYHTGHDIVYP